MEATRIIVRPVVTEKTSNLREAENKYVFEVSEESNKYTIRTAVEEIFKVNVVDVQTWHVRGKNRRRGMFTGKTPDRKRAAVKLKAGESIEIFEQV